MRGLDARPVMVVDDSDDDHEAIDRALRKGAEPVNDIIHFYNGEDALKYLRGDASVVEASEVRRPCMVLLDLNMPGMDGWTVLKEMKADEDLCNIPVVILTTSNDDRDVAGCYQSGANSYVVKSVMQADFVNSMQNLKSFWLGTALLPPSN